MTEVDTSQRISTHHPNGSYTSPSTNSNSNTTQSTYTTPRSTDNVISLDQPQGTSQNYQHSPGYNQREVCKKCNLLIIEGHAYELGEDRWHIDCFKCSKCGTSLGCNSNFLVLGNGNLICSNCSYNCKQCGRKIDGLAILTGDQA